MGIDNAYMRIRMALLGGTQVAAEARAAGTAIGSTGTAAQVAGARAATGSKGIGIFSRGLSKMFKIAKWGSAIIAGGLILEIPRAVNAFRESEKVGARTAGVIKSIGAESWTTADQVADLAASISAKIGVDDEEIQSMQNILLTFKDVRNEVGKGNAVFDRASKAAVDMSAAFDQSFKSSAVQLGKALNDPEAGASALSRIGAVQASEVDKIAQMAESGASKLELQRYLLEKVEAQVKGAAKQNADPFDKMNVAIENLEEELGRALFPTLAKVATAVSDFLTEMREGTGTGGKFKSVLQDVGTVVGDTIDWIKGAVEWTKNFIHMLLNSGGEIGKFRNDIFEIGKAIKDVFIWAMRNAANTVGKMIGGIKQAFGGLAKIVGGVVKIIGGILTGDWSRVWEGFKDVFSGVWDFIKGAVKSFAGFFEGAFDMVRPILDGVIGAIEDVINVFIGGINTMIDGYNKVASVTPLSELEHLDELGADAATAQLDQSGAQLANGGGSNIQTDPLDHSGQQQQQQSPKGKILVPMQSTGYDTGGEASPKVSQQGVQGKTSAKQITRHVTKVYLGKKQVAEAVADFYDRQDALA